MPTLQTHNLLKQFDGVKALDHLSISIEKGKITGIIGPNGSGKSTLINTLTGLTPITGGTVVLDGKLKLTKIKSNVASTYGITRTFQDVRLFEQMPTLDNVLVALTERNVWSALFERHKKFHLEKAEEVLRRVGLWNKKDELAINLSYGQRKLLEIARVLAMNAEIYLFDEPFAGLFPEMIKTVVSVLKELRVAGKTVILIEHNVALIRELSDYVIVMDSGKLLAEGEPEKVLSKPEVIEAYLGE
ncbi:MAG: ABC transporter ATP-binding protein [Patescibacteria group bacterium]